MVRLIKIFEPFISESLELKNRIVMPGLSTRFGSDTGAVTERTVKYYVERAKGGVGLIVTECLATDYPMGMSCAIQLRIDDDRFVPGLNHLAEAVQAQGAKISAQLMHAGKEGYPSTIEGAQRISASDVPSARWEGKAKGLTIKEIEDQVEKFGKAARRAKMAGFDAVEIHGAHGYLIANFLSPYTNKRNDHYGSNLNGRMRFALAVVKCVKDKVGSDYPVMFRLNGDDLVDDGLTLSESITVAKRLEQVGVDILSITGGVHDSPREFSVSPMAIPRGHLVHLAAEIKGSVNIPVIAVGRINDPTLAERILKEGKADLIAMGRALVADPELPRKAAEGRLEDIRKCIACNYCISRNALLQGLGCTVNVEVGYEDEYALIPTERPKKILIAGGGPGGMEVARVASLRGHDVMLCEKDNKLGGQLNLAALPPHKEEIRSLIEYFAYQIRKLGVKVLFNSEVTPRMVKEIQPDAVVVATGSLPFVPKIKGIGKRNVVTAWDVLAGNVNIGERVTVVGGGQVGCECTELLAVNNKKATVVEMLENVALDMDKYSRQLLVSRFEELGIKVMTNTRLHEILDDGVLCFDKKRKSLLIQADTVVLAVGSAPNNRLATALHGRVPELHIIGDCLKPGKAAEAIRGGSLIGRKI